MNQKMCISATPKLNACELRKKMKKKKKKKKKKRGYGARPSMGTKGHTLGHEVREDAQFEQRPQLLHELPHQRTVAGHRRHVGDVRHRDVRIHCCSGLCPVVHGDLRVHPARQRIPFDSNRGS